MVFVASKIEGHGSKYVPHTALELISSGRLTFDGQVTGACTQGSDAACQTLKGAGAVFDGSRSCVCTPGSRIGKGGRCVPEHSPEASPPGVTPSTLHSAPYTLHPTPYTLHPIPFTLNP